MRVATWDEPISLDPANTAAAGLNPVRLMFDTLVTQRADSTPAPGVAESWAISADGRAYTFKLKDNVRFHDGTPLDAQAVKFSLDRATSPQAKANFTISLDGIYQAAEVRDELTVRIVLTAPYAPLLDALATGTTRSSRRRRWRSTAGISTVSRWEADRIACANGRPRAT